MGAGVGWEAPGRELWDRRPQFPAGGTLPEADWEDRWVAAARKLCHLRHRFRAKEARVEEVWAEAGAGVGLEVEACKVQSARQVRAWALAPRDR